MKWRKLNNVIHRDLGYLCFGLTVIYAISGVAVNHIADWNPNYRIERVSSQISPVETTGIAPENIISSVLSQLGETGQYKDSFLVDQNTIKIFVEGNTITANLKSGRVSQEQVRTRKVLHEMNFLHLNHPKKIWTWFADLYAVALMLLAGTGLFVLRGKRGITGRGAWLTTIGLVMPVFFIWLYI
jgi:hypothetical protein